MKIKETLDKIDSMLSKDVPDPLSFIELNPVFRGFKYYWLKVCRFFR